MVSICILLIVSGFRTYDYFLKEKHVHCFLKFLNGVERKQWLSSLISSTCIHVLFTPHTSSAVGKC